MPRELPGMLLRKTLCTCFGLGVKTNVDLQKLLLAGDFISKHLGRPSGSKTAIALSQITSDASKI